MVYILTVCCTWQFLYVREDDQTPFGVWNGMVPFSYLLENGGGEPDMEDMDCTVEQLSVNLMGSGEVEVKAVLAFNCFQKEPVQIQNIESAEFRPDGYRRVGKPSRNCRIFRTTGGYIMESCEKI